MISGNFWMNKRIEELIICAIEQGYSFRMEGRIWIDLIVYLRLKEIYEEDLKSGK